MAPTESPAMAVSFRNFLRLKREQWPPFASAFEVRSSISLFAPISPSNKIENKIQARFLIAEEILSQVEPRALFNRSARKRVTNLFCSKKLISKNCVCSPKISITLEYIWLFIGYGQINF
jgi:hypothetical protein